MRSGTVRNGAIVLFLGIILSVFGYADIMYWLTDLSADIDYGIIGLGSILFLVGIIYVIYGLVAKARTPDTLFRSTNMPRHTSNVTQSPTQKRPAEMQSTYCTKCGIQFELDDQFCQNCGTKRRKSSNTESV